MTMRSWNDFFLFVEAERTTNKFLLLTILTFGWYTGCWLYSLIRRINIDLPNPRISVFNYLVFIILNTWLGYYFQGIPEAIGYGLLFLSIAIEIAISVQTARDIEDIFCSEDIRCKLPYAIIFNIFYVYYLTHKAWKLHNDECKALP